MDDCATCAVCPYRTRVVPPPVLQIDGVVPRRLRDGDQWRGRGVVAIIVGRALEDGGGTWSRAGFGRGRLDEPYSGTPLACESVCVCLCLPSFVFLSCVLCCGWVPVCMLFPWSWLS